MKKMSLFTIIAFSIALSLIACVSGSFTSISTFLPPPPLPPLLSDLDIMPSKIDIGDNVTISLVVTNVDNQSCVYTVIIQMENVNVPPGLLKVMIDVELEAHESKTISHTITPRASRSYGVRVNGLTGSFYVRPKPLKPAEFRFSDLEVIPEEVVEGSMVRVYYNVTNVGETEGWHVVKLYVNGEYVAYEGFILDGGVSINTSFDLMRSEGVYQVEVEGLTGRFTVLPHPSTLPSTLPFWRRPDFLAAVGAAVVIIVASAVLHPDFKLSWLASMRTRSSLGAIFTSSVICIGIVYLIIFNVPAGIRVGRVVRGSGSFIEVEESDLSEFPHLLEAFREDHEARDQGLARARYFTRCPSGEAKRLVRFLGGEYSHGVGSYSSKIILDDGSMYSINMLFTWEPSMMRYYAPDFPTLD